MTRPFHPKCLRISLNTIIGLFCLLTAMIVGACEVRAQQQNPLDPLDTSSPRATIQSFFEQAQKLEEAYVAYRRDKSIEGGRNVIAAMRPARRLFDLSDVPPANRTEVSGDAVVSLFDILVRLPEVPLDEIPGGPDFVAEDGPERWTYPDTEIDLVRIEEGPREGEYLVSPETVARLATFHALIIDQPRQRETAYDSARVEHALFTGPLFPYDLVEALPDRLNSTVLGTPAWKVILAVFGFAIIFIIAGLWGRLVSSLAGQGSRVRSLGYRLTRPLVLVALIWLFDTYFIRQQVNLSGSFAIGENILVAVLLYASAAWFAWLAIFFVIETVIASPSVPEHSYDAHLLRLLARVLSLTASGAIIVYGANDIGIPALGLVAGLGVGGFALALAAQSTVENLFGGVSLFADRPFRVGDFIHYGSNDGVVESIGPRSSRVRGLDGTVTTVPNADLAKMHITNYSNRDKCLFHHVIGLRYETSPLQFEWLLNQLWQRIAAHELVEVSPGMPRIRLAGFGDFAINIDIRAYILTTDYGEFMKVQEELILEIMKAVDGAGTGFAFPSTTAYLGRDGGLDPKKTRHVETLALRNIPRAKDHRGAADGPLAEEDL